jgi:nucleoid DNA-binding protein
MNHTERVHEAARQVRGLTRDLAREAIEHYLAMAAEELTQGDWVTLPFIGKVQITPRETGGMLQCRLPTGEIVMRKPGVHLQVRVHMSDEFRLHCRASLVDGSMDSDD